MPGTFDFSAPASAAALPNRLYATAATGTMPAAGTAYLSPFVTAGSNYGSGFSFSVASGATTPASATTLVISPIMAACVACHDTSLAIGHMQSNGGSFYAPRSTALGKSEQCTLCHLTSKVADIAAMHAK
jgi:hypothetical protein